MEEMDIFDNAIIRKRGRPAGKRRMPLSREQRKARNAQYERERRNEIAEATSQLAESAGYDQSISISNLLTSVIDLLENNDKRQPTDTIKSIKQKNEDMQNEINELTQFLAKRNIDIPDSDSDEDSDLYDVQKRGVKTKSSKVHQKRKAKKQCLQQDASQINTEFDFDIREEYRIRESGDSDDFNLF